MASRQTVAVGHDSRCIETVLTSSNNISLSAARVVLESGTRTTDLKKTFIVELGASGQQGLGYMIETVKSCPTCSVLDLLASIVKRYEKKAAEAADETMAVPLSTPAMVMSCLSRTTGPGIMLDLNSWSWSRTG